MEIQNDDTKQKNTWHELEAEADKVNFIAFNKCKTGEPMTWFIRRDRLNRSPILEALFFQRLKEYNPHWDNLSAVLPEVRDAREMYHLLHWINRDQLVVPCVLSLNRCLQLANLYGITQNTIRQELQQMIEKRFEVVCVFHCFRHNKCISWVRSQHANKDDAIEAMKLEIEKCVNPNFFIYTNERDDELPYNHPGTSLMRDYALISK
jgi:hypothetical protein